MDERMKETRARCYVHAPVLNLVAVDELGSLSNLSQEGM